MDPQAKLYSILETDPRYPINAYAAVHKGLEFTLQQRNQRGHVDGQELAFGMAGFLQEEYGPFARWVLEGWNIRCTMDIGNLVFNLVNAGLMSKQDSDTIEAFRDVFDFEDLFGGEVDWLESIRSNLGLPSRKTDPSH